MFDIISKREFWAWQDAGLVDAKRIDLKGIQDAYVLHRLQGVRDRRVLEIGGGNSRVLAALASRDLANECWNADRFEGVGSGPTESTNSPDIRVAKCFLGEFSHELPDQYFDYVISVSVVEHVPIPKLEAFFADSARVVRPGGTIVHAIDLYVYDADATVEQRRGTRERVARYLDFADRSDLRIRFTEAPRLTDDVSFRCSFASNTDLAMNQWNRIAPTLRPVREVAQSVSIKAEWSKF